MYFARLAAALSLLLPLAARADVVINEIFYRAPEDQGEVQWIELHNTAAAAADIGDWTLDKGKVFVFPKGTSIEPKGYLVVALNVDQFRKAYDVPAIGPLKRPLKRSGERIELADGTGKTVDAIRYKDRDPWPLSADGYSASLERICPSMPGEGPENWAASPLPTTASKPAGTPGKQNASFSAVLPPVIFVVNQPGDDALPGQSLRVEAEVKDPAGIREVSLLYRAVVEGVEEKESAAPMTRDEETGRFTAGLPAQKPGTILRYRIKAIGQSGAQRLYPSENDLRPTLSLYVHEPWQLARIPFGFIIHVKTPRPSGAETPAQPRRGIFGGLFGGGEPRRGYGPGRRGPDEPRLPRGSAAFVYVDQKTGKTTLFDHVNVVERGGERGYKVHFHKDRTLNGMTVASIIFEGSERFLVAEALAYDVYRRAGNAASLTEFIRLWVDGRMMGYHLLIEQPNRAFLRRNKVRDDGNLYKLLWYGRGITGQHEKRTNPQSGHDDLLKAVQQLQSTKGDEQWKVIQDNFNVNQVATYFAVNTVLSHWDGFFNNYFTYHDIRGTGKWEIYPWDQDKTWGHHDGIGEEDVFFDMPLTFGMDGDKPPRTGGGFFGGGPFGGAPWWRPGGYFSGPLLANPQFRKIYLARVKEIAEKVYTQEAYFPVMDEMTERLKEDIALRGRMGRGEEASVRQSARVMQALRTHLVKRRQFLLDQPELRSLSQPTTRPATP